MPKRKRPEDKPEEQFKRFLETARLHEVDEKDAEKKFKKISSDHTAPSRRKATLDDQKS